MTVQTIIGATITARVGWSGAKQHAYHVMIRWEPEYTFVQGPKTGQTRPAHVAVYTGQVYCGSQRAMSGSRPTGLNTDGVTCERCLKRGKPVDRDTVGANQRWISVADATRALAIDARGNLVPTEWATEMVTPKGA